MSRVVFVGLGQMGAHLARHIVAASGDRDVEVFGVDTDAERAAAVAADIGISPVAGAADVAQRSDVVCLSVPDGRASRAVGDSLVASGRAKGVTVFDLSSVSPADARALHQYLAGAGASYVDCPVTGGLIGAQQGTLTTIVGAGEGDHAEHAWVLESFSSKVVYVGATGAGALVKTLNNQVCNIAGLASMEAIAVARKAGIPDDKLLEVLNSGTGQTYFSQVRYPRYVASGSFDAGMRIGLVNKDLDIAMEAAAEVGLTPPICTVGQQIWRRALDDFGPAGDTTLTIDTLVRAAGGGGWAALSPVELKGGVDAVLRKQR